MMLDGVNENQVLEQDIDPAACRLLWCAILKEQWDIVFCGRSTDSKNQRQSAMTWFGGRDFQMVCSLAGMDPKSVFEAYHRHLAGAV